MNPVSASRRSVRLITAFGPRYYASFVKAYFAPSCILNWERYTRLVSGKHGIEFGGPSPTFKARGQIPVYSYVGSLDNCNFGSETVWEGKLKPGMNFVYSADKPPGRQYVTEAYDLGEIPDAKYDFVLSCHMLEHTANPLKAVMAWNRILKPGASLILLLPEPKNTFDHRRPLTSFAHILSDYEKDVGEDDMTHWPEIKALHDLRRDDGGGTRENFERRSLKNFENRCFHQHVFSEPVIRQMLKYAGFRVRTFETHWPDHMITWAEKE